MAALNFAAAAVGPEVVEPEAVESEVAGLAAAGPASVESFEADLGRSR